MPSEADETITYNNPGLKESGLLIINKMAKIKSDYRIIAIKDIWMLHQMNDMDGREYTTEKRNGTEMPIIVSACAVSLQPLISLKRAKRGMNT